VAVRAALGAGRGRLVTQFLTENIVLAGLGAVAGLALAVPAMRFLETLVPETMGNVRLALDWRVLGFSAGAASAATLTYLPAVAVVSLVLIVVAALASLVPARRASRIDPLLALQHE
jgi:ABC-type antimicrobial peptide transport system permease subunit